jgi:endonuclease YncB( thermonuclease family)
LHVGWESALCGHVFPPDFMMIQDKSTRFTLVATGILLLALFLIGWLLSRTATAKREGALNPPAAAAETKTMPVPVEPAAPVPETTAPAPSLPLNEDGQAVADYQVITQAELLDDPGNDGDTFLLKVPEGQHRFCLYFVDTVETDGGQPEAARDMAGYFEFDSEEPLRQLGLEAKEFSKGLLKASAFRVVTRWEKSPEEQAYQAFIYLKDPDKGLQNLAQMLVRYGLARIIPCERDQPDGMTASQFRELLLEEEAQSKAEALGAWNKKGK